MLLLLILIMLGLPYLGFGADTNQIIAWVLVIVGAVLALTGWPNGPLIVINRKTP